jgi:hypothetical protein
MKVYIRHIETVYVLTFEDDQKVYNCYTFKRLIDAIGMASILQIHVTNIEELALSQYLNQRGTI